MRPTIPADPRTDTADLDALAEQLRGFEAVAGAAIAAWLDTWALIDETLDRAGGR